jgi:hypothetical protein
MESCCCCCFQVVPAAAAAPAAAPAAAKQVNARLAHIEARYGHSSTGDSAYPKVQWPSRHVCASCRLPRTAAAAAGSGGGRRSGGGHTSSSSSSSSQEQQPEEQVGWNEDEVYRCVLLVLFLVIVTHWNGQDGMRMG